MNLSPKNEAYKSYLKQAKQAYKEGDLQRARGLFLKAAEIANQITLESTNPDIKNEYYKVTQTILDFVKKKCSGVAEEEDSQGKGETKKEPQVNVEVKKPPKVSLEEALSNLNKLVGLETVKRTISDWVKQIQVFQMRKSMGLKVPEMSYHLVFTGNPGTGKTTVARIIGQIYCALGILKKGQLVEVDRSKLVAGYVGQTGPQTQKVIEQALGGVLFIDEAYSLAQGSDNDFGPEAIATLLKAMEDKRDEFAVIVAGYREQMEDFINSNPGLASRFKTYIHFEDYGPEELFKIFEKLCIENDYKISEDLRDYLKKYFKDLYDNRDKNFGNGRDVRNIFEKTVTKQSRRIAGMREPSIEEMMLLTCEDLDFN